MYQPELALQKRIRVICVNPRNLWLIVVKDDWRGGACVLKLEAGQLTADYADERGFFNFICTSP
jgi:hypothetical protein